jgi:hypothetical protein
LRLLCLLRLKTAHHGRFADAFSEIGQPLAEGLGESPLFLHQGGGNRAALLQLIPSHLTGLRRIAEKDVAVAVSHATPL